MWHTTKQFSRVHHVQVPTTVYICNGNECTIEIALLQAVCDAELVDDCNGEDGAIGPLPQSYLLPSRANVHVSTGGGASLGFEQPYMLVR
jgi:hypothetical protein